MPGPWTASETGRGAEPLKPRSAAKPSDAVYSKSVFEAIVAATFANGIGEHEFVCDEQGVRVKDPDTSQGLEWHPASELADIPGGPDPLEVPWLPFPFSANQLAALLLHGWGYFIRGHFGEWEDGPDEDRLLHLDQRAAKAKDALRAAFQAYRHAAELAPKLDPALEQRVAELKRNYNRLRKEESDKVGVHEFGIARDEYWERVLRVNNVVSELNERVGEARKAATAAEAVWRRNMVRHLLLPVKEVPADAFSSEVIRALPVDRREEAIHQLQTQGEFRDSEAGRAHWDLVREQQRIEAEQRRWQLMHPQSVTEAVLHDAKLKELAAELTAVSDRMRSLAVALAGDVYTPPDYARLATPDELVAAFGSYGLKRSWFDDLKGRKWLLEARKVLGQGQRGRRCKPLFCPFEVMTGLIDKSRTSKLSPKAGWRILEQEFPAVYAAKSVGDPREPPG